MNISTIAPLLLFSLLPAALSGCSKNRTPELSITSSSAQNFGANSIKLTDVAVDVGVNFKCENGEGAKKYSILETVGSGLGWLDFDSDGIDDLLIAGGGKFQDAAVLGMAPSLFRGGAGVFQRIALDSFLSSNNDLPYSHGVLVADYNNDGFEDALITGYDRLLLLRNNGDGTFTDIAEFSLPSHPDWTTGAAWGDFDRDGTLDLYCVGYVDWSMTNNPECFMGKQSVCSPIQFDGLKDELLISDGAGNFRRRPLQSPSDGKGLGAMAADIDRDGDIDVYVANDTTPNFLLNNDGTGNLTDMALESGTSFGLDGDSDGSMGIDLADYNRDGNFDLWVTNFEGQSFALYENRGSSFFQHSSIRLGLTSVGPSYVGFGTNFIDLNSDGFQDLICTNGHVTRRSSNAPLRQLPLAFANHQGKTFENVRTATGYLANPHRGRGLASCDYDRDGDMDIAISHINDPVALLRNDSDKSFEHWVGIQLVGRESPRTPIGTLVTVSAADIRQEFQLKSGNSYLSSSSTQILCHVPKSEKANVEIVWPSGRHQSLKLTTQSWHTVIEPNGGH